MGEPLRGAGADGPRLRLHGRRLPVEAMSDRLGRRPQTPVGPGLGEVVVDVVRGRPLDAAGPQVVEPPQDRATGRVARSRPKEGAVTVS